VTSVTSHATVHNAAFPACQTPGFTGETEGISGQYEYQFATESSRSFAVRVTSELKYKRKVRRREKTFFVCNLWSVRLLQFARRDQLLGND
jgi:hypothetical protein